MLKNGFFKALMFFFLMLLLSTANARLLSGERDVNVSIVENETAWTHYVEQGKWFYFKTQITDVNGIVLRDHHIGLKVEDERGAIINDYTEEVRNECDGGDCSRVSYFIVSDDNGFINYAFQINPCTPIQNDFCFHPDQNYHFRVTQKNLDYRGEFTVSLFKGNINWFGNLMRTVISNFQYFFILLIGFIILVVIGVVGLTIFKKRRGR